MDATCQDTRSRTKQQRSGLRRELFSPRKIALVWRKPGTTRPSSSGSRTKTSKEGDMNAQTEGTEAQVKHLDGKKTPPPRRPLTPSESGTPKKPITSGHMTLKIQAD